MDYSPKLKKAAKEIDAIIQKYDIGAFVLLHDKRGFAEFLNRIEPSYSCLKVMPQGVKVRLKTAELGEEKAHQMAEDTYSLVAHFADMLATHASLYIDLKKMLQDKWGGWDGEGKITGRPEQEN